MSELGPSLSRHKDGGGEIDREPSSIDRRRRGAEEPLPPHLAAIGLIAGQIAHDLNNHLTVVIGNVQLILRLLQSGDREPRGIEALLKAIERSGLHAAELAGRLRETAKPAASSKSTATPVESIIDLALAELRPRLPEQVELRIDCEGGLEPLAGDEHQLSDLLLYLLHNAVQSLDGGPGTISLRASARTVSRDELPSGFHGADLGARAYVEIEVVDSGRGVDPELQAAMFKPFVSGSGRQGLGLAIAVEIARRHGGAIAADSVPPGGAHFRVLLPVRGGTAGG